MVEAEGVEVKFTADDKDVNARLDNLERRLGRAQEKAKKGGKAAGAAFFGGFAGGAMGVVSSGVEQTGPVSAIMDLLMNVLGAAILPIIQSMLPLLKGLADGAKAVTDGLNAVGGNVALNAAGGAAIGGYVAGPPGAVGGAAIAATATDINNVLDKSSALIGEDDPREKAYGDYLRDLNANHRDGWQKFWGLSSPDETAYDKWETKAMADYWFGNKIDLSTAPPQEQGKPYSPNFPPPNVSELHGPTVVNTG